MSMITPALPVDVYSIHSIEKKNAYPFCRIGSIYIYVYIYIYIYILIYIYICNAHGIIKSHRFSILLG